MNQLPPLLRLRVLQLSASLLLSTIALAACIALLIWTS